MTILVLNNILKPRVFMSFWDPRFKTPPYDLCFHGLFKQAQLCEKSALFEFSVTRRFQVQVLAQLLGPEVPVPSGTPFPLEASKIMENSHGKDG